MVSFVIPNPNTPALPTTERGLSGFTKREHMALVFAVEILRGQESGLSNTPSTIATLAVNAADALLAKLDKDRLSQSQDVLTKVSNAPLDQEQLKQVIEYLREQKAIS